MGRKGEVCVKRNAIADPLCGRALRHPGLSVSGLKLAPPSTPASPAVPDDGTFDDVCEAELHHLQKNGLPSLGRHVVLRPANKRRQIKWRLVFTSVVGIFIRRWREWVGGFASYRAMRDAQHTRESSSRAVVSGTTFARQQKKKKPDKKARGDRAHPRPALCGSQRAREATTKCRLGVAQGGQEVRRARSSGQKHVTRALTAICPAQPPPFSRYSRFEKAEIEHRL